MRRSILPVLVFLIASPIISYSQESALHEVVTAITSEKPESAFEDLLFLEKEFQNKVIISIGEATHGTREFAFKVGLPGKSGVGGGIIAIHPGQYALAVWSPKLNMKGNSYRGVRFLEAFTTQLDWSIF